MSDTQSHTQSHSAEEIRKHIKVYVAVFVALLVGTVLTVGAWTLHIDSVALTIAVALFIASVKAFLVAGYFMHLMSEKKTIYCILICTVFFFIGLMALTLWSMNDFPVNTIPR